MKKLLSVILTMAIVMTMVVPADIAFASESVEQEQSPVQEIQDVPQKPEQNQNPVALTEDHVKYVESDRYGRFRPSAKLTRAEAADMVYNLLAVKPEEKTYCSDVVASTKYSKAAASLLYLGLMKTDSKDRFYPAKAITQKDFKNMIAKCLGKPESFTSTAAITRGEAVKYLNSKLGRANPDKKTIKTGKRIRIFTDVPTTSKYYYDAMEASIGHTYTKTGSSETWDSYDTESTGFSGSGWKVVDGETFYISKSSGVFLRNCTVANSGGMKLNASGRYTTGNSSLDAELRKVMKKVSTNNMAKKTRLKKCFQYVYKNCKYRADVKRAVGSSSWDKNAAYKMLSTKKGNCYHFAAAFTYLAKKCGYDAKTVSGYIYYTKNGVYFRHGWTEITMTDGSKRVCDPEIQYLNYIDGRTNNYFYRTYEATHKKPHFYYYSMKKKCR